MLNYQDSCQYSHPKQLDMVRWVRVFEPDSELTAWKATVSADKCPVQMLRGKLIPKQSIVCVAAIGSDEKQEVASAWVLTPTNHLLERENLASAHSMLPGLFPKAVYAANFSNRNE